MSSYKIVIEHLVKSETYKGGVWGFETHSGIIFLSLSFFVLFFLFHDDNISLLSKKINVATLCFESGIAGTKHTSYTIRFLKFQRTFNYY